MISILRLTATAFAAGVLLGGCISWNSGVTLVSPVGKNTVTGDVVDTTKPTFVWEAFKPADADPGAEITYDLFVWKQEDKWRLWGGPTNIVIQNTCCLSAQSYTVDSALEPDTTYYWQVRPRYTKAGSIVTGEWSRFSYFGFGGVFIAWGSDMPYFFKVSASAK